MTELLVATKKGLFAFDGVPGGDFSPPVRAFAGEPVDYAMRDPRSGRLLAAVTSPFYGPKIWFADDAGGEWTQADGVTMPEDGDALVRVWTIVAGEEDGLLYAGGDPGVLFESRDGGESWTVNQALWQQPSRPDWQPGGGGLCIHSIVPWPGDPDRLALGISAAGVWLTEDGGASWERGNAGIVAGYVPDEARGETTDLCIHNMQRARDRPERLFMQFHGGVYRSDDAGRTWIDIAAGLPGDFGFPMAVDPADPDSAFVIPLTADMDRVTAGGRARVYVTRDAGESWAALGDGLPQEDAYLTILRHAFGRTGEGPGLELYFGTTSGHVFGSGDAGASWSAIASCLPTVHSVVAVS
ncbi:MAG: exo-alpha-sialidase [Actinomycetota bacterium]|nr:exo-alpha-sialidase [Actinomycetota bacterium]